MAPLPFDEKYRCTALSKRTGERCKSRAHPGAKVCRMHGGGAPQVRRAARRRIERERLEGEVARLLEELEFDVEQRHPIEVLLQAVSQSAAMANLLSHLVGALSITDDGGDGAQALRPGKVWGPNHLGDGAPHVLVEMYERWLGLAARTAKAALDAGIDERLVRLRQAEAEVLAGVMRSLLGDVMRLARRTLGVEEARQWGEVEAAAAEQLPEMVKRRVGEVVAAREATANVDLDRPRTSWQT